MSQVLRFPTDRIKRPVPLYDVEDLVEDVAASAMSQMIDFGYSVQGDDNIRDVALIVESLKAAMARSMGRPHGLHAVSNNINIETPRPVANTVYG